MSIVEVHDHVLWIKHIHGNEGLKADLHALEGGDVIELSVDGFRGYWKKMDDGRDGRPTPGIKPIGPAREHWQTNLADKRGALVPMSAPDGSEALRANPPKPQPKPKLVPAPKAKSQMATPVPSEALGRALSAIKNGTV